MPSVSVSPNVEWIVWKTSGYWMIFWSCISPETEVIQLWQWRRVSRMLSGHVDRLNPGQLSHLVSGHSVWRRMGYWDASVLKMAMLKKDNFSLTDLQSFPSVTHTNEYLHCPPNLWNHPTRATSMLHSCWKSMLILIGAPWQYIKDPSRPPDKVWWSTITFAQSQSDFFLGSVDFPSSQTGDHANQYPVCNFWKYRLVLDLCDFSQWYVEIYWSVSRCDLKSPMLCSWDQCFYPGHGQRVHRLKMITSNVTMSFSVIWWETAFSQCPGSGWSWSGELDALSFPCGPKTFSNSWISPKTSRPMPQTDSWSLPPPLHVGTQTPELEPPALINWSCVIFVDGSAATAVKTVSQFFVVLLKD